jgi:hypothetical protein
MKSLERVGTFVAYDAVANGYTLVIYQAYEVRGGKKTPTAQEIESEQGEAVNRLEQGRYELFGAIESTILTSEELNAP